MPKHHPNHIVYFELTVGEIETITLALREQMRKSEILILERPHMKEIGERVFNRLDTLEQKLHRLTLIQD